MKILKFIEELFKVAIMGGVAVMVIMSIILMCSGFSWYQYWLLF